MRHWIINIMLLFIFTSCVKENIQPKHQEVTTSKSTIKAGTPPNCNALNSNLELLLSGEINPIIYYPKYWKIVTVKDPLTNTTIGLFTNDTMIMRRKYYFHSNAPKRLDIYGIYPDISTPNTQLNIPYYNCGQTLDFYEFHPSIGEIAHYVVSKSQTDMIWDIEYNVNPGEPAIARFYLHYHLEGIN